MKTKILLAISIVMAFAQNIFAQEVNGLKIGEKYTKNQIIAALGQPDEIRGTSYIYGRSSFYFDSYDNTFVEFYVEDQRFITMTKEISGGLRVGDNVSKARQSKCEIKTEEPNYICFWHYGDWAVWGVGYDNNGKITDISFTLLC